MSNNRFNLRLHFDFKTSQKIFNLISEINELRAGFKIQTNLSPQVIDRMTKSVLITSSGASTRIEGSHLTDKQVKELFQNHKIQKFKTRDQQEVAGYLELLAIVFDNWESINFSENTIKQFHAILLKYSDKDSRHKGVYKFGSNRVEAREADGTLIGIIFDPTPPHLVPIEMQELVDYTIKELSTKEIQPILIIANFIFEYLAIHPFQDGNGRSSRVLTNLLLLQAGYSFIPFISHERIIEENKEEYYNVLNTVQRTWKKEKEDLTAWFLFFLDVVKKQATQAIELIEKGEDMELILSEKQYKVWNIISTNIEPLSISSIEDKTNISRDTIRQALEKLVKLNKIEVLGQGKGTRYRVK
jgi:Fic family protein